MGGHTLRTNHGDAGVGKGQTASPSVVESDRDRWRFAVAGVLAKSTRRDRADLPAEPERLLDSPAYEGFAIRPLYTSLGRAARAGAARAVALCPGR